MGVAGVAGAPMPVSVHALGEFRFCPRAGVNAHEAETPEQETDYAPLDYLPKYEVAAVERELNDRLDLVWVLLVCIVGSLAGGVLLRLVTEAPVFWAGVGGAAAFGVLLARLIVSVLTLAERLTQARAAAPGRPPEGLTGDYPVNWWRLLADGFESQRRQEPLFDRGLGLVGSPWRVLARGDLRVPVVRCPDKGQAVWPKHRTRLAAYACLLAEQEGGRAPYGVILFGGAYDGVAVPVDSTALAEMKRTLREARRHIESDATPPVPTHLLSRCLGCPHGKPVAFRAGRSEFTRRDGPLVARPARDRRGVWRHSRCGDRYGWTPPHRVAELLGLSPGHRPSSYRRWEDDAEAEPYEEDPYETGFDDADPYDEEDSEGQEDEGNGAAER